MLWNHLRFDRNWDITLGARWGTLHRHQLGVNVTIQLIVDIEVALVLQGGAAGGTTEAVNMQVLVLDPDKDTTEQAMVSYYHVIQVWDHLSRILDGVTKWVGFSLCGWFGGAQQRWREKERITNDELINRSNHKWWIS